MDHLTYWQSKSKTTVEARKRGGSGVFFAETALIKENQIRLEKRMDHMETEQKHYHYNWAEVEDEGARFENLIAGHLLKKD